MKRPVLPEEPTNLFTIEWWEVVDGCGGYNVWQRRAVYHIHTPWEVFAPDEADRRGAPLHDDWMVYHGAHPTGRNSGWSNFVRHYDWDHYFATRQDALRAAIQRAKDTCARKKQEIAALRSSIAVMSAELAGKEGA